MYEHHKNNAIYNNESVKILKNNPNDIPETVQIQYRNGEKEWIETKLLRFNFNLKK